MPQLLSRSSRAHELQLLSLPWSLCSTRGAVAMRNPHPAMKRSRCSLQLEQARTQQQKPSPTTNK